MTTTAVDGRYKWTVVGLLWFVCLFNYADRQAIFSVFPLLKAEMHLSDVQLGYVASSFMWVYAAAAPFAGMVGDRFRRKHVILGGLIFWSLITVATALSTRYWHLVVFRGAGRIRRGVLLSGLDVADQRVARQGDAVARHVVASIQRLCGHHHGRSGGGIPGAALRMAARVLRVRLARSRAGDCADVPAERAGDRDGSRGIVPLFRRVAGGVPQSHGGGPDGGVHLRELCGHGVSYVAAFVPDAHLPHEFDDGRFQRDRVPASGVGAGSAHRRHGRRRVGAQGPARPHVDAGRRDCSRACRFCCSRDGLSA